MTMRRRQERERRRRERRQRLTHESRDFASSLADRFRKQAAEGQRLAEQGARAAGGVSTPERRERGQESATVSLPGPDERVQVASLAIRWFSYDAASETFTVEYKDSGDVYAYHGVPLNVMEDVLTLSQTMPNSSRSVFRFSWGRFVNFDIKPNYTFSKIG